MLVYANSFWLSPPRGPEHVIEQIATWIGAPRGVFVDPAKLASGIGELRLPDGSSVSSIVARYGREDNESPYYFCTRLVHGQQGVPGRRWVAEIGVQQESTEHRILCSVLVRTDEISARVTSPVQTTRPKVVELIINNCSPSDDTPGLGVIQLNEISARSFADEIVRKSRRHPIVELSCKRDGSFPISSRRLQSVLVGLAQVVEISSSANTHAIEEILGRRYAAFGGAINVISPPRAATDGETIRNFLFTPSRLSELVEEGFAIETEILASVTHQTNLPHSWRHISMEGVREQSLRQRMRDAISAPSSEADLAPYEALLVEAGEQLSAKDRDLREARVEIESLTAHVDEVSTKVDQLSAENTTLKHNLRQAKTKDGPIGDLFQGAEAVRAVVNGNPTLEEALQAASALFADRLVVLDSAFSSARNSDRAGFQEGAKAFEMLRKLADEYWEDVAAGKGDQHAKATFGKNGFAAKEAETLSTNGRKRRTFRFAEQDLVMEKHLKHGVKDSAAETLRIHFEWIPTQRVIVLGHCGKHLDF